MGTTSPIPTCPRLSAIQIDSLLNTGWVVYLEDNSGIALYLRKGQARTIEVYYNDGGYYYGTWTVEEIVKNARWEE